MRGLVSICDAMAIVASAPGFRRLRSQFVEGFHRQHEVDGFFHECVKQSSADDRFVLLQPRGHGDNWKVWLERRKVPDGVPSAFVPGTQVEEDHVDRLVDRLAPKFTQGFLLVLGGNNSEIFDG